LEKRRVDGPFFMLSKGDRVKQSDLMIVEIKSRKRQLEIRSILKKKKFGHFPNGKKKNCRIVRALRKGQEEAGFSKTNSIAQLLDGNLVVGGVRRKGVNGLTGRSI